MNKRDRSAIVGMGPRGLGAMEARVTQMQAASLQTGMDVIDPFPCTSARDHALASFRGKAE